MACGGRPPVSGTAAPSCDGVLGEVLGEACVRIVDQRDLVLSSQDFRGKGRETRSFKPAPAWAT